MKRRRVDVFYKKCLDFDPVNSIAAFRKDRKKRNKNNRFKARITDRAEAFEMQSETEKTSISERFSIDNMQDIYNYLNTSL